MRRFRRMPARHKAQGVQKALHRQFSAEVYQDRALSKRSPGCSILLPQAFPLLTMATFACIERKQAQCWYTLAENWRLARRCQPQGRVRRGGGNRECRRRRKSMPREGQNGPWRPWYDARPSRTRRWDARRDERKAHDGRTRPATPRGRTPEGARARRRPARASSCGGCPTTSRRP